jgi:hypothetical protein
MVLYAVVFFLDKSRIAVPLSKLLALASILFLIFCGCLDIYEKLSVAVGTRIACFLLSLLVVLTGLVVILRGFGPGLWEFTKKSWSFLSFLIEHWW